MIHSYSFNEQLRMSHGIRSNADVAAILMAELPGALAVRKADEAADRNGTDWWVDHVRGEPLSIDAKVRGQDYKALKGKDDLALETWSVIEERKVGWTRDARKRTDYILWLWTDTGRWCLVPFPMLCAIFQTCWRAWRKHYQCSKQRTPWGVDGEYHSECVFVPRREVWKAIYLRFADRLV